MKVDRGTKVSKKREKERERAPLAYQLSLDKPKCQHSSIDTCINNQGAGCRRAMPQTIWFHEVFVSGSCPWRFCFLLLLIIQEKIVLAISSSLLSAMTSYKTKQNLLAAKNRFRTSVLYPPPPYMQNHLMVTGKICIITHYLLKEIAYSKAHITYTSFPFLPKLTTQT